MTTITKTKTTQQTINENDDTTANNHRCTRAVDNPEEDYLDFCQHFWVEGPYFLGKIFYLYFIAFLLTNLFVLENLTLLMIYYDNSNDDENNNDSNNTTTTTTTTTMTTTTTTTMTTTKIITRATTMMRFTYKAYI
jgi:hypothetical protein